MQRESGYAARPIAKAKLQLLRALVGMFIAIAPRVFCLFMHCYVISDAEE